MLENLQEMIRDDNDEMYDYRNDTQHMEMEEIEQDETDGILRIDTPTVKPETDVKNGDNAENSENSAVSVPEYSDVMNLEYEPETEEELIILTKALNARMDYWQIGTYWMIGYKINGYYERKGNYGKGTLEKISLEVDIGIDTLRKALKFARVYNETQLKILLSGNFYLKWNDIAQNLTVEPEKFVEVFKETNSSHEFNRNIMDCKKIMKGEFETRGAATNGTEGSESEESANSEIDTEESIAENIQEGSQHSNEREPEPGHTADIENVEENPDVSYSDEIDELNTMLEDCKSQLIDKDNSEEIEVLNELLEDAKSELMERDKQKHEDERIFDEMNKEIEQKDAIIERLKQGFKQLVIMVENGAGHADLLDMIGGIEFDTICSV